MLLAAFPQKTTSLSNDIIADCHFSSLLTRSRLCCLALSTVGEFLGVDILFIGNIDSFMGACRPQAVDNNPKSCVFRKTARSNL